MPEILQLAHPWIAAAITLTVFVVLQVRRSAPVDLLFTGALMAVTLVGILSPADALQGFANPALLTVAGLFIVSAGLRSSGVLDVVGQMLLGKVHTTRGALWRIAIALVSSSAFMLNTALVAMMAPVVVDWCRKRSVSPSRLLIPVSYFTILGGVCTLIGTSTTLVVNAKLNTEYATRTQAVVAFDAKHPPPSVAASAELSTQRQQLVAFAEKVRPMGLLEIGKVGLPCAIIGGLFLFFAAPYLLPNRTGMLERLDEQRREYLVEMRVLEECRLIGKTVEDAGLRHLPGLFLIEIDRDGEIITPVEPRDRIRAGDRLVFTGVVTTIVDLEKIPGLVPAADLSYEFNPAQRGQRHLTEVVLSRTSPLIGQTVRDGNFRQRYNAAVVAVHRNGLRLTNKIGNIVLEPGDTLLLQTGRKFVSTYRNSREFYLVSSVTDAEPRRHDRARIAALLAVLLVVWLVVMSLWNPGGMFAGFASPAVAAICIAGLMIVAGCMRLPEARQALDMQTIITIGAALGLGLALDKSGAASGAAWCLVQGAEELVWSPAWRPYVLLIVIYIMTVIFTEMITNNAVAAMLFPLAVAMAWEGGYSPRPFVMAITTAASLSFVTPIGYQTNLMVMGPGGYRPVDYLKCGFPLAIVVGVTALTLIPMIWPF